ncbi:hypothetical protein [Larkinella rosea]|uniref:TonB C-terminal domain-containing protein n=1 Tax=Larkinella rosea TaxID=2025312 RepID=A0A3P1BFJ2_9BACT|nr:hypothetical protein [Larkinella rosea]RRA99839.1 hypothetical protein EHT25_24715 [Larkinella rosea]
MRAVYLILSIFMTSVSAKSDGLKPAESDDINMSLSQQLISIITYPQVLSSRNLSGIVVVEFYLTDGMSISGVKVLSENQALNSDLIRQLTGKKIHSNQPNLFDKYTVKLVFNTDK